jgi:hypothetical protein
MFGVSSGILIVIVALTLVAVAAGTFTARFFIAASRTHAGGAGSDNDI